MNEDVLEEENKGLNVSGFNDDSMISESDEVGNNNNLNFLANSNTYQNLEKNINEAYSDKTDSLLQNFEIISPSNKNTGKNISLEDIFSNQYNIPTNRPSKYSSSRLSHQFIYESNSKTTSYKIDSKKFGISQNNQIITYLINLYIFSEFANVEEIERDQRIKVVFIKQNKIEKRFSIENINSILNNLEIPNDKINDFENFIKGMNDILSENEYLNIHKKQIKKLIINIVLIIIMSLLIIFVGTCMGIIIADMEKYSYNKLLLILGGIILLSFIFGLIYKIIDAKNSKLLFLYYKLRYLLINYNKFCEYVETWNKNLFENYKIRAIIPVSLNYIMFNLNPYQNVEIKHLDMNWMKQIFYKSKKNILKSDKDLQMFNSVKNNLLIDSRNNSSSSIN